MNTAFCYSWADEVIAHKIMKALKPLEQEGKIDIFIPQSYTGDGDDDIVDGRTAIILLSRMALQDTLFIEDAFSCYGCGQLQIPILVEDCDFLSIEAMKPHEMCIARDEKGIRQMKYLTFDQQSDEESAIRTIVAELHKMID